MAMAIVFAPAWNTGQAADKVGGIRAKSADQPTPGLWIQPTDLTSRNLFYGPGGEKHVPRGPFTFVKEDLDGTHAKFIVKDEQDVKWKVKLGDEVRSETAASRFVWAVGYYTNEDYFVDEIKVQEMPRLRRGNKLVGSDGTVKNVRMKRYLKGEKKVGEWRWKDEALAGRELNGLRVMMALINNWDLKDVNNSIYEEKSSTGVPEKIYMVSDLGATFGPTGVRLPLSKARANIDAYSKSEFVRRVTPEYVDFRAPTRPQCIMMFAVTDYVSRTKMQWIGRHIPVEDVRWIGGLLSQLSAAQIRDAFRAAGYTPEQTDAFAKVVVRRIEELRAI